MLTLMHHGHSSSLQIGMEQVRLIALWDWLIDWLLLSYLLLTSSWIFCHQITNSYLLNTNRSICHPSRWRWNISSSWKSAITYQRQLWGWPCDTSRGYNQVSLSLLYICTTAWIFVHWKELSHQYLFHNQLTKQYQCAAVNGSEKNISKTFQINTILTRRCKNQITSSLWQQRIVIVRYGNCLQQLVMIKLWSLLEIMK